MYVVWGGANDLLKAVEQSQIDAFQTISKAAGSQVAAIKALKDNGENYILVPNIPDVGLTPKFVNTVAQSGSTDAANLYN